MCDGGVAWFMSGLMVWLCGMAIWHGYSWIGMKRWLEIQTFALGLLRYDDDGSISDRMV